MAAADDWPVPSGQPTRGARWLDRLWRAACAQSGVKGPHFHDLRHPGNTLAASTGAGTRELMAGMGRSTARAALTYQHVSAERERLIADAVSALVEAARQRPS